MDDLVDDPCPALTLPHPGSVRRLDAEQRLRRAIDEDQIEVWFQPQIRLCTGEVLGYEALARWRDPERGVLGPDRFIPLAEETGEIVALGQLLLERACRELVKLDSSTLIEMKQGRNVFNHRGKIIPILDLRIRLGLSRLEDELARIEWQLAQEELRRAEAQKWHDSPSLQACA